MYACINLKAFFMFMLVFSNGFSSIPEKKKKKKFRLSCWCSLFIILLGFGDLWVYFVLQMFRSFTISVTLVSYFVTLVLSLVAY